LHQALLALLLERPELGQQLAPLIAQAALVENRQHLRSAHLLVLTHQHLLQGAAQHALHLGDFAGRTHHAGSAHGFVQGPERRGHRTARHRNQQLPTQAPNMAREIGKDIVGTGWQQQHG